MPRQLLPHDEEVAERIVAAGEFEVVDQVIDAALRLLEDRQGRLRWLRAELATGEEQERRGELVEYTPDFRDRPMREHIIFDRATDEAIVVRRVFHARRNLNDLGV